MAKPRLLALDPLDRSGCMLDTQALALQARRKVTLVCDNKSGVYVFSADANGNLADGPTGGDPRMNIQPIIRSNGTFGTLVRNLKGFRT